MCFIKTSHTTSFRINTNRFNKDICKQQIKAADPCRTMMGTTKTLPFVLPQHCISSLSALAGSILIAIHFLVNSTKIPVYCTMATRQTTSSIATKWQRRQRLSTFLFFLLASCVTIITQRGPLPLLLVDAQAIDGIEFNGDYMPPEGDWPPEPDPASVMVVNHSREPVNVFWMNPETGVLKRLTAEPLAYLGKAVYMTHVSRFLEVYEVPDETTGECHSSNNNIDNVDQTCRKASISVVSGIDEDSTCYDLCILSEQIDIFKIYFLQILTLASFLFLVDL